MSASRDDTTDTDGDRTDDTTVAGAIRELRAIRSTDPCASIALTTIKATIHTLETHWLRHRETSSEEAGG